MNKQRIRERVSFIWGVLSLLLLFMTLSCTAVREETKEQHDARMKWWREARFGMFIHWGLYAIPAGEWKEKGVSGIGEWIMHYAQIPVEEYELLKGQFNPVKFDADKWVRIAKNAGMKYIVITSKHHDGFCLFDSKYTDYDIISTPFKRDIMKELADACHKHGLKICWYHSIMDWHHPDYLPRRKWETRSAEKADFNRYIKHMKSQIKELVTNYGEIGVLWFDGEWESTWDYERGRDLYNYVRSLQPDIIINNRVGKGRVGMSGTYDPETAAGDFGTPEQEIPATGLGYDWETCMTMNDTWGFKKNDHNWKSKEDLIRKLVDIASKGGNFLLNVGPTAEGEIPQPSVARLEAIGRWLEINGEAIYATKASPFKSLPWGRCTRKALADGTIRLYLHVFSWPEDKRLILNGLANSVKQAFLLAGSKKDLLEVSRHEDAVIVQVPSQPMDPIATVVVLDINGPPDVIEPPEIMASSKILVDVLDVEVTSERENVEIRYTIDQNSPTKNSLLVDGPIRLTETATIRARVFCDEKPVSGESRATFTKVKPRPSLSTDSMINGLKYEYFEGDWDKLPDFEKLDPVKTGTIEDFVFSPRNREEYFGFRYKGFIAVPQDGVYVFYIDSDDGSRLYIGEKLVVDNDGLHGPHEEKGVVALSEGAHPICVTFFEKTGGDMLEVMYSGPDIGKQQIPPSALFHKR